MLALFAEGERLFSRLEAGDIEQIAPELAVWQRNVSASIATLTPDQAQTLHDTSERLAHQLAQMGKQLTDEMNVMRKQHSSVQHYVANG